MIAGANSLTERVKTLPVQPPPTLPAHDLGIFLTALGQLGFDQQKLLAAAGLRAEDLQNADNRISCSAYGDVIATACKERFIPNLALEMARVTPLGAWPLIDYLVLTSDSVGAGIHQLARYLRLTSSPVAITIREDVEPIIINTTAVTPFAVEFHWALVMFHLRRETDGEFKAISVAFQHKPDDPGGFERMLGCPVAVNAPENQVVISTAMWKLPLRRRDPVLRQMLERQANELLAQLPQTDGLTGDVQRALATRVAGGDTRVQAIARELRLSPRTLQRRLAEEGVTYQSLVDGARKNAAARYLGNSSLAIGEVAYLVGFSEPAPFYRAFRRWFSLTPEQFRQQHRGH